MNKTFINKARVVLFMFPRGKDRLSMDYRFLMTCSLPVITQEKGQEPVLPLFSAECSGQWWAIPPQTVSGKD